MINHSKTNELLDAWNRGHITSAHLARETGWSAQELTIQTNLHKAAIRAITKTAVKAQVQGVHEAFLAARIATGDAPLQTEKVQPEIELIHQRFAGRKALRAQNPAMVWLTRIAASVALIAGLWLVKGLFFAPGEDLYTNFYQEYAMVTERGESTAALNHTALIDQFRNKDYKAVVHTYDLIQGVTNRERFLAGYAAMQLSDFRKAILLFDEILENNQKENAHYYQDEAEYYKGLVCIKAGDFETAASLFNQINSNKLHTYKDAMSSWQLLRLKLSAF